MIKKYIEFIREWGTDANKPQIKIGDRVISDIDMRTEEEFEEEEERDKQKDLEIMFASVDMSENLVSENDPYGEENWEDKPRKKRLENEYYEDEGKERLVKLIDQNGVVLDRTGWAIEGQGTHDDHWNHEEYIGGVAAKDSTIFYNVGCSTPGRRDAMCNQEGVEFKLPEDGIYRGEERFYPVNEQ